MDAEFFLVHYATYNWQNFLVDIFSDKKLLMLLCLIFGIVLTYLSSYSFKKHKLFFSKLTQTESELEPIIRNDNFEGGDFLLNYILNHKLCFSHIINCWISNFNDFQQSNIVSKKCQIINFSNGACDIFKCSEVTIVENKEIFSFTFLLNCDELSLNVSLKYDNNIERKALIVVKNLKIMALVIVRIGSQGLIIKLCPENVGHFVCDLNIDDVSLSEKEMSVTEFGRDLRLVLLQTIEMNWSDKIKECSSIIEMPRIDQGCQVDLSSSENIVSHSVTTDDISESTDTNFCMDPDEYDQVQDTPRNVALTHNFDDFHVQKKLLSQASLFTADSSDCYEKGEESPFHDRSSSKLVGRTLVVTLVKIVEANLFRVRLKKGYCVLELDEPYQRHVSHLISLDHYPLWNQHFIFSLNCNSQRISVELMQVLSKKYQTPVSLGVSLIPISLIIVGQSENTFPISTDQFGSRLSLQCDSAAGSSDIKMPAFIIEFQIMRNAEEPLQCYQEQLSERSSGSGTELLAKGNDTGNKMETISESQVPSNECAPTRSAKSKVILRAKVTGEGHRPKSVMRKLRNRLSQLSVPWMATETSNSDNCLNQSADKEVLKTDINDIVPVQPPPELFRTKNSEIGYNPTNRLSSGFKKMLNFQGRKSWRNDQYKDKSLEHLFNEMDPKIFDAISKDGFDRIMNDSH